jgi:hypothetical protein
MYLYLDEDGILVEARTFELAPTSVKLAALPKQSNKQTLKIRHGLKKRTVKCGTKMCEQCWGHLGNAFGGCVVFFLGLGVGGSSFGRVGGVDSCPVCAAGLTASVGGERVSSSACVARSALSKLNTGSCICCTCEWSKPRRRIVVTVSPSTAKSAAVKPSVKTASSMVRPSGYDIYVTNSMRMNLQSKIYYN